MSDCPDHGPSHVLVLCDWCMDREREKYGRWWLCQTCGIVASAHEQPWCRHNDLELAIAAERMVPLPPWHPLSKDAT